MPYSTDSAVISDGLITAQQIYNIINQWKTSDLSTYLQTSAELNGIPLSDFTSADTYLPDAAIPCTDQGGNSTTLYAAIEALQGTNPDSYLPLVGGTMTGDLIIDKSGLTASNYDIPPGYGRNERDILTFKEYHDGEQSGKTRGFQINSGYMVVRDNRANKGIEFSDSTALSFRLNSKDYNNYSGESNLSYTCPEASLFESLNASYFETDNITINGLTDITFEEEDTSIKTYNFNNLLIYTDFVLHESNEDVGISTTYLPQANGTLALNTEVTTSENGIMSASDESNYTSAINIGTVKSLSSSTAVSLSSSTWTNLSTLTLGDGIWAIQAAVYFAADSSDTSLHNYAAALNTASANAPHSAMMYAYGNATKVIHKSMIYNGSSITLKAYAGGAAASVGYHRITAIKVG